VEQNMTQNRRRSSSLPTNTQLPKPVIPVSLQEDELFLEPRTPEYFDNSDVTDDSLLLDSPVTNSNSLNLSSMSEEGSPNSEGQCINISALLEKERAARKLFGVFTTPTTSRKKECEAPAEFSVYTPPIKTDTSMAFNVRYPKPSDPFKGKRSHTLSTPSPIVNRYLSKDDMHLTPSKKPIKDSYVTDSGSRWDVIYANRNKMFSMSIIKQKKAQQDKENQENAVNTPSKPF
jgi:hypothetical protein